MEAGLNSGSVVIMGDERTSLSKHTEGTWDGKPFEVSGRETACENNILKGLKHCAGKKRTKIAILDYPNGGFSREVFDGAFRRYVGFKNKKQTESQYVKFDEIICVQGREIVYRKPLK